LAFGMFFSGIRATKRNDFTLDIELTCRVGPTTPRCSVIAVCDARTDRLACPHSDRIAGFWRR
jgi:hypothetical protein